MADVQDVARFFIDLAKRQNDLERGDLMTNLRLQKLLYFAQGWHLARFGRPLFDASTIRSASFCLHQVVSWSSKQLPSRSKNAV